MVLKFPEGFLWGSATAAHQVEGGNENNDWWDWEQKPGYIQDGGRSTIACDWWAGERYRQDFDLAKDLYQNAHRLSVEWSRIEPRAGEWNPQAIGYYRRVLTALLERDMVPLVTLHHFTNPRWLVEKGAWETQGVIGRFERYVSHVVQELGDLCSFWVTINEPTVYMFSGYINGNWPPCKRDFGLALRVGRNIIRAHAAAYHAIHRLQPQARVGIAHNIRPLYPENRRSWLNRKLASIQNRTYNHLFLLALTDGRLRFPMGLARIPEAAGTQDYVGLNFYFSGRLAIDWSKPTTLFARQMPPRQWGTTFDKDLERWFGYGDIDPEGFYSTVKWLSQFGKPIYIGEHGICDPTDEIRPRVLVSYLAALHRAIQAGAPVKGYFHWTLVDNFEWKEGYGLQFGLFANDLTTQERTPRPSAKTYARIARENGIATDLLEQYDRLSGISQRP